MFFPSLSAFFKLLNPSRSLVHSSGALTLAFEANNENNEADQAGLLLCPVLSWVSPPLHLAQAGLHPLRQAYLQLGVQNLPGRGGPGTIELPLITCQLQAEDTDVPSPLPGMVQVEWL